MPSFRIVQETPASASQVEPLLDRTFGTSRQDRTVYRLREGHPALAELSFAALSAEGDLLASLRFWPILIEAMPAILLGPLAVEPALQGQGIGKALVRHGLTTAKQQGHRLCVVVGEPSYYGAYGFRNAHEVGLVLPGPVDPLRFQVLELQPDALLGVRGRIRRDERLRRSEASEPDIFPLSG
ncbi:MAG: N-acetyltransferase [Pseudomonadota bacterium]